MDNTVTYSYKQDDKKYNVSFSKYRGNQMVNITEMTKPFKGKSVKYFLEDENRRIITEKICLRNSLIHNDVEIPTSLSISMLAVYFPESILIKRGANNKQGTWVHRDIALEYSRYLSPDFALWCNDKVFEYVEYIGRLNKTTDRADNVIDYLSRKIQKEKSKAVAEKNYADKSVGQIMKYYIDLSIQLTNQTPSQLKSFAKKHNIPQSIINGGGREVLRFIDPETAAITALVDDLFASNPDMTIDNMTELVEIGKEFKPLLSKFYSLGYGNLDLEFEKKREKYNRNMLNENNEE